MTSRITLLALQLSLCLIACGGSKVQVTGATTTGPAAAPSITMQPSDQTVVVGQPATFTVTATGTAPLSYQWQKAGAPIAGATAPSYPPPAPVQADSGSTFTVVVSNSAGSITSNSAKLNVITAITPTSPTDGTTS